MTGRTQQPHRWGAWLSSLAALVVVWAVVFGTATASAANGGAETRVRASQPVAETGVGASEGVWAGQRLQEGSSRPGIVVGTGVAANSGRAAANACRTNSFTGETLVLMADGSKKPIKDVKLGDRVMAIDPETGERGPRKVIDLIRHGGLHTMVAVRLADGNTIDATDHHPFWVASRGEWVDAIDLEPGDEVLASDGRRIVVERVGIRAEDLTAYNLTVDGLHTYYAGDNPVLVHNAGCMSLTDALVTEHGQQRLAERGFDSVDIAIARSSNPRAG